MKNFYNTLLLLAFFVLSACSKANSENPQDPNDDTASDEVKINFSASPKYLLLNDTVTLNWSVTGAISCTISGIYSYGDGEEGEGDENSVPSTGDGSAIELAELPTAGSAGVLLQDATTNFTISCLDNNDATHTKDLQITVSSDADADNYPDTLELVVGTKTDDPDSDDDGIPDGTEDSNRNGMVDDGETDPLNPASRNPYYCDGLRTDNESDGLDVSSSCINPEIFAAGDRFACLIMNNGITRCWGRNLFSQLGINGSDKGDDETAAHGSSLSGLIQIAAADSTACGIKRSGSVHCWGKGSHGATGHGNTLTSDFRHSKVDLPEPAIQVATSGDHSCAVTESGKLYCWGYNSYGQLGYGNKEDVGDWEKPEAVGPVDVGFPVKKVSVGSFFTCALSVSGNVKCWGNPSQGLIGMPIDYENYGNYFGDEADETPVSLGFVTINGGAVFHLSSGRLHSCAMAVGAMTCWGQGSEGKLGYGSDENVGDDELASDFGAVPYGGGDVTSLATGGSGTCVSLASGDARCWGAPTHLPSEENFGDNEPASNSPLLDFGDKKSAYITVGGGFICALMRDQTVYCWGQNDAGQLGLGHSNPVVNPLDGQVDYF